MVNVWSKDISDSVTHHRKGNRMSTVKPMTISHRTQVYLVQNNGGPLTSRQRRRYDKKVRRWLRLFLTNA